MSYVEISPIMRYIPTELAKHIPEALKYNTEGLNKVFDLVETDEREAMDTIDTLINMHGFTAMGAVTFYTAYCWPSATL